MEGKTPLAAASLPALTLFVGRWHLRRRIWHADGTVWHLDGHADFMPRGPGLAWRESGGLTGPDGVQLSADRHYFLALSDAGGLDVFFGDGRPFHVIPAAARGTAVHLCPPDHYEVRYRFAGTRSWQSLWRVSGPRKAYRMLSFYTRDGTGPAD